MIAKAVVSIKFFVNCELIFRVLSRYITEAANITAGNRFNLIKNKTC